MVDEFNIEICYPAEIADPFFDPDNEYVNTDPVERDFTSMPDCGGCIMTLHYA